MLNPLTALNPIRFNGTPKKHSTDTRLSMITLYTDPSLYRKDTKQASGTVGRSFKVLA